MIALFVVGIHALGARASPILVEAHKPVLEHLPTICASLILLEVNKALQLGGLHWGFPAF